MSNLALEAFFLAHPVNELERVHGWVVQHGGDIVWMTCPARDREQYRTKIECVGYPAAAPSVLFVNGNGLSNDRRAWPRGTGIIKPPPAGFLCTQLTREGLQHHGEWLRLPGAWAGSVHTLMDSFGLVHRLLNTDEYPGRHP